MHQCPRAPLPRQSGTVTRNYEERRRQHPSLFSVHKKTICCLFHSLPERQQVHYIFKKHTNYRQETRIRRAIGRPKENYSRCVCVPRSLFFSQCPERRATRVCSSAGLSIGQADKKKGMHFQERYTTHAKKQSKTPRQRAWRI